MKSIVFKNEKDLYFSLYGILLGDGSYNRKTRWMTISHTNKQRYYCEWLYKICMANNLQFSSKFDFPRKTTFGDFIYSEIRIKPKNSYYFESKNKFFDSNGKKIISDYVMENITDLGLLFWYLDDGNLSIRKNKNKPNSVSRFAYLNTQGFSLEDNKKIQKMFKDRFDIDTKLNIDCSGIDKTKKYYRIYINATNFRKFYDVIRKYLPYIPKEFEYKFNMKYEENKLKTSKIFSEKYNFN